MFDPFDDFKDNGYLRNFRKDKDLHIVKRFEHDYFEANIDIALDFLKTRKEITYQDFLEVHRILFADYYPWAGKDRKETTPNKSITKENVLFAHPNEIQRAIEHGLKLANNHKTMNQKFGEIMGLFAYAHPFLDCNGRTMLLVHVELCHRAGFSIEWNKTNKSDYLKALTDEIDSPSKGILDCYLLKFKVPMTDRSKWEEDLTSIAGLDGLDDNSEILGHISDPAVIEKYKAMEAKRGYSYSEIHAEKYS